MLKVVGSILIVTSLLSTVTACRQVNRLSNNQPAHEKWIIESLNLKQIQSELQPQSKQILNSPIKRSEFAELLFKICKFEEPGTLNTSLYIDVSSNDDNFLRSINALHNAEIMIGIGNQKFSQNFLKTRELYIAILKAVESHECNLDKKDNKYLYKILGEIYLDRNVTDLSSPASVLLAGERLYHILVQPNIKGWIYFFRRLAIDLSPIMLLIFIESVTRAFSPISSPDDIKISHELSMLSFFYCVSFSNNLIVLLITISVILVFTLLAIGLAIPIATSPPGTYSDSEQYLRYGIPAILTLIMYLIIIGLV